MKVLLVGEYSGVHNALKAGLRKLGHVATLAAHGDAWKQFPSDISLGSASCYLCDVVARLIKPAFLLPRFEDFDAVQFINPLPFTPLITPTRWVLERNLSKKGKVFLLAAGGDSFYFSEADKHLRYSCVQDILTYDYRSTWRRNYWFRRDVQDWCRFVHDAAVAVIPTCYDFSVCYSWSPKRTPAIPFPIDVEAIEYRENKLVGGRLTVHHGLNRAGAKGTKHVLEAFRILEEKYPNDFRFIVTERMPISEYQRFLGSVNVVVDQTSAYSPAMNALYALATGRIVLGGSEPEHLDAWRIKTSPVINIRPDADDIVTAITRVLDMRHTVSELGAESRRYVESVHSAPIVAEQYLKIWGQEAQSV